MKPAEEIGRHEVKINRTGRRLSWWKANGCLQVINSVNFDDYESLQYFQRVLINSGVIDALREAGVQEGDTVSIYEPGIRFCGVRGKGYGKAIITQRVTQIS